MLTLGKGIALALAFSQAAAYTLMAPPPKIYGQSMAGSTRPWSSMMPYPFRAYQPSVPLQYYGRYYGDPYFAPAIQNADYFYSQDPYTASFDDTDYYSNYLYYIPPSHGRRVAYYDQPIVEPVDDDLQDYDDDDDDNDEQQPRPQLQPAAAVAALDDDGIDRVTSMQREWWLEKNVMPNEDTDFDRFDRFDELFDYKPSSSSSSSLSSSSLSPFAKSSKKPTPKTSAAKEARKNVSKTRYAGIDGFGRKKDKERVYGSYRLNPSRRDDQPSAPVYADASAARYNGGGGGNDRDDHRDNDDDNDDADVQQLKQLYRDAVRTQAKNEQRGRGGGEPNLDDWMRGHVKKDGGRTPPRQRRRDNGDRWPDTENVEAAVVAADAATRLRDQSPPPLLFSAYNEAGQMTLPESLVNQQQQQQQKQQQQQRRTSWSNDYVPQHTSVFDTIKKLLALEDGVEQKSRISKRMRQSTQVKPSSQRKAVESTTSVPTTTTTFASSTTMRQFPAFETHSTKSPSSLSASLMSSFASKPNKTRKRSAATAAAAGSGKSSSNMNAIYTDEESLVRELSALRHRRS